MPVSRPPTGDEPTVRLQPASPPPTGGDDVKKKSTRRKAGLIAGAVFGALAVLYGVDLILSTGEVPRGVTVVGVDVGGETRKDAEAMLRDQIEPRLTKPVGISAGDVDTQLKPADAGLTIDWVATLDRAGDQPFNPITRLTSFFTTEEVGIVTTTDNARLTAAVDALRAETDREPADGGIKWDGVTPVAIEPKQGQKLDADGARQALVDGWATGRTVELPVDTTPVKTTAEGVQQAIEDIAKPAVSGPVTVHGEGKDATLTPKHIARALTFAPAEEGGGLTAKLNHKKVVAACKPQLASTEIEGKDAEIVFSGGSPTVTPSVHGKGIDWKKSFAPLMDVLKQTENREIDATYVPRPAEVTTEEANKLGIKEVISEFTTGGFAPDSGVNIRQVAEEVDGAIVKPGDTFSLNGHTGPRTEAQGYVAAGIIEDGAPGRAVGGGISQFATTLYNAAYFAAMTDAGHQEHSYYISRYPAAREATVFQNPDGSSVIDLKFTNDTETGIAIQTIWTPSSITVRFWGTKTYEVESITGGRSDFTEPETKQGPKENCHASNGSQGFTTSDTRIVRNAATGAEVSRNTRTVSYNPQPKIVCKPPD
ncbi:VanW family protein [Actinophytocola gossypii]|uniref:VanW family protein n=1 Tax=Actinophytocola gossypii TaxID=2812003 RepID=A0ABT2JFV7_9PSEU|nr:VanW family protein [Actinophytocola gossypii]MCT2586414.1 VanW family protein [Actinophytocola gossypii]